jgi:CMP-N,N'-diacetyllegionaminic acid synthase
MSNLKNFICIIPARAGSKGIKNKNLVKIKNKPLIQYTIDVAKKLSKHCEIVVSTDSPKIKKICIKNELEFYGLRPKRLSSDTALTKDVVMYEVKKIEKKLNKKFFGILLLQPTCPIRDYKKLMKSMQILKNEKFNSVVSVADVGATHPFRMKKIVNGYLKNYMNFKTENMAPRQNLPKVFIRSGSFYIIQRNYFFKKKSLVGDRCYGYKLNGLETTNIDNINDLLFLKLLLNKKKIII